MARRHQKSTHAEDKPRPAPAAHAPAPPEPRPVPAAQWAARHGLAIIIAAAFATHLIHWLCVRGFDPFYALVYKGWDQYTYWEWGKAIAAGDWWSAKFTSNQAFYYGPLYPYFLALVFKVFGVSFEAAHITQGLAGLAAPALLWAAARRLFGPGAALATGLLAAFCAPLLFYEQVLLMEWMVAVLSALLLWLCVRGQDSPKRGWLWSLAAGATLGAACLARGNFLLLAPLMAAAWLVLPVVGCNGRNGRDGQPGQEKRGFNWGRRRWVAGAVLAAAFAVGCSAPLGLSLWRNWHVSRDVVLLTTNGPVAFYIGNASDSSGIFSPPPSFKKLEDQFGAIGRVPWGRELKADLSGHFGAWLRLMVKKTWMFWNSYDVPDNVSYYLGLRFSPLARFSPISWLTLVPLALLGLWGARRAWRRQLFLYVFLLGYSSAVILAFISGRYRVPMLAPLSIWAGAGATTVLQAAWRRRWKPLLAQTAAVALGIFVLWPSWSPGAALNTLPGRPKKPLARMNDYTALARAFTDLGKTDKARQTLEAGFVAHPYASNIALSLASMDLNDNQPARAVKILEAHRKAAPPSFDAAALLGLAYLHSGDRKKAEAIYGQLKSQPIGSPQVQALMRQLAGELGQGGAGGGAAIP